MHAWENSRVKLEVNCSRNHSNLYHEDFAPAKHILANHTTHPSLQEQQQYSICMDQAWTPKNSEGIEPNSSTNVWRRQARHQFYTTHAP